MSVREWVLDYVRRVQGCKATDLPGAFAVDARTNGADIAELADTIDRLIAEGELVEVEYVLASMPFVVKSFLLPVGTEVRR